jgi:uncharacterized protein YjdB
MSKWKKTQDEMPYHLINVLVCVNTIVYPAYYNHNAEKWYSTFTKEELPQSPCWWMSLHDIERPTEE